MEVLEHQRGDVGEGPLVSRRRIQPAKQEHTLGIIPMQRAMASAADVVGATPVHELETELRRDQHVAGVWAVECRPETVEGIGIDIAVQPVAVDLETQHGPLALNTPAAPASIAQGSLGCEAQLATPAAYHSLSILAGCNQVDALGSGKRVHHVGDQLIATPL